MSKKVILIFSVLMMCLLGNIGEAKSVEGMSIKGEVECQFVPATKKSAPRWQYGLLLKLKNIGSDAVIYDTYQAKFVALAREEIVIGDETMFAGKDTTIWLPRGNKTVKFFETKALDAKKLAQGVANAPVIFSLVFTDKNQVVSGPYEVILPSLKVLQEEGKKSVILKNRGGR